jgi:hypothetical protein
MHGCNGSNGHGDAEDARRLAHRSYERAYIEMRAAWSPAELQDAIAGKYDLPLPYDGGYRGRQNDDDESHDPADRAVDTRVPIVDFESVGPSELQRYCDDFRACLVWATRSRRNLGPPELMQMGARMLALFHVVAPELKVGMNLPIPRSMREQLRSVITTDPLELGKFFILPLAWVRKCASLVQLGKRGYSMIYVLAGDLIDSKTCAGIGGLDNKTRQAANKPIQDFRDSFQIKSLPMRGKVTRKRCKEAQERR